MLFFHGGGFVLGDLGSGDRTCAHLCVETGALVIAVDYRPAPEHPCPAAVTDAWTALCWTAARATELGVDPARRKNPRRRRAGRDPAPDPVECPLPSNFPFRHRASTKR